MSATEPPNPGASALSPNRALLDAMDQARAWVHVRKTRRIWAKEIEQEREVGTIEGTVKARAGDFLCRGEAGELWPQDAASLRDRYVATETVDADGWRKYEPQPDAEGAMAAQVPHAFSVVATWGTLNGKAGDYVLKRYGDRDGAYPADVWIVDQALFRATYEPAKA